jgi:hypothetical protein
MALGSTSMFSTYAYTACSYEDSTAEDVVTNAFPIASGAYPAISLVLSLTDRRPFAAASTPYR